MHVEPMDIVILGGFVLYFVPAFAAVLRRHPQQNAIIVLTIFGGWTVIGWLIALVWASTQVKKTP